MRKDNTKRLHRSPLNNIIIVTALAIAAGRIAVVSSADGQTAFQSANDRSRWCTVASLVEHGTYAIDAQIAQRGARNSRPWDTIDKVRHADHSGKQHYYSSKPTLYPTIVAGIYGVIRFATGLTLTEHPLYLTRILLALVNLPLLALFYYATTKAIKHICDHELAGWIATFSTCFGTMLLPFAMTLNNHLPAAAATSATLLIYLQGSAKLKKTRGGPSWKQARLYWFVGGLAAAFAATNELPALSMLACWLVLFVLVDRKSALPFVAGASLVAAAFFATNWIAHQSLRPPYAHTGTGAFVTVLASPIRTPDADLVEECRGALVSRGLATADDAMKITLSDEEDRWVIEVNERRFALIEANDLWRVHHWDDWYEYPGTYWKADVMRGLDRGEPSTLKYLLHTTVGHHGVFSLTPLWLLLPIGFFQGLNFRSSEVRRLIALTMMSTVICFAFYLLRPEPQRNYGGVSSCFRWLLWFAPLWLFSIVPALDRLSKTRPGRGVSNSLLAMSVFSVSLALGSPWQHPWIYQWMRFFGLD